jgi:hypothetical protein
MRAVLVAAVALMATAHRAVAEPEIPVSIDYQVAPELADCPNEAEFRKEVARQLRRDPFRDSGSRVLVRLYTRDGRLGGRIEWQGPQGQWEGERTFSSRSESCAAMARAIEMATAIQIEMLAALGEPPAPESAPPDLGDEEPPPSPIKAVVQEAALAKPVVPREPHFAVSLGVGVMSDAGSAPTFAVPSLAVAVGRPPVWAVRLTASGLGPSSHVAGLEGTAALDRFVATLDLLRSFRRNARIQPLLAAGVGVQDLGIQGSSAMPTLAAAHQGHRVSGLVSLGAGVGVALARRLSVVLEGDALLFTPAVTVNVGSTRAAYLNGVAAFFHGGLLATF